MGHVRAGFHNKNWSPCWESTTNDRGPSVGSYTTERALGDGPLPSMGWARWLAHLGLRDGLQHQRVTRLAPLEEREGDDGIRGTGAGVDPRWGSLGRVPEPFLRRSVMTQQFLHRLRD
jgi:hypothetical protein